MRSARLLGVFAVAVTFLTIVAPASAATKYVECQHPVTTGVEVSRLSHVSSATACQVALSLYRWENSDDHADKLYKCSGGPAGQPVLKMHSFDGWALSIARYGYFDMSRGASSFAVSGTDFPLACN